MKRSERSNGPDTALYLETTFTIYLVQIKLTEITCPGRIIVLCCFRMSLEHTHENIASVSGPFIIEWMFAKKVTALLRRLPEYLCLRLCVLIPTQTEISTTICWDTADSHRPYTTSI